MTVRVADRRRTSYCEVEDNGPGIPAEQLANVRQRFARGGQRAPGTGPGLPIVEEIAGLFGGTLSLQIPLTGRGLLVLVTFPKQAASKLVLDRSGTVGGGSFRKPRLHPPEGQIGRAPALAQRLGFVAGARPAGIRLCASLRKTQPANRAPHERGSAAASS